ncbi:unnamed protein product [Scytosiphon promiscuus]
MKISVEVGGQKMEVMCGEGGQSLRWLALVASQRLQLMQPKGRQRLRESGDARRGFALPKTVLLKGHGDLDDPHSMISDVLEDGAQVEVVLMDAVEVDDVGAPVSSEWFLKAFGSGEATKRRLNGIRMRDEYETKLASEEDAGIGGVGGFDRGTLGFGSRRASGGGFDVTVEGVAISGPLETPGQIRVAMEHDWRSADVGGLVEDPTVAVLVKAFLQSHLPKLNEIHSSFSGGRLAGGSTAAMSFHDFAHALHRCGVMSFSDGTAQGGKTSEGKHSESHHSQNSARVRAVFDEACRGSWPGNGNMLSRAQFLAALVLAALDREGAVVEALREIVEETLLPMHAEAVSDEVGVEIARTDVQNYISDNRRLLHSVYVLYADPSEDGALVTLEQFRELMDDCGVLSAMTATTSGRAKFDFQSETCFLQVQGSPPLPSLVFNECIEAACRLAIMTAEDSSPQQTQPGTPVDNTRGSLHQQQRELDAIYLVLDCIIDLGLGDRGLNRRD